MIKYIYRAAWSRLACVRDQGGASGIGNCIPPQRYARDGTGMGADVLRDQVQDAGTMLVQTAA